MVTLIIMPCMRLRWLEPIITHFVKMEIGRIDMDTWFYSSFCCALSSLNMTGLLPSGQHSMATSWSPYHEERSPPLYRVNAYG